MIQPSVIAKTLLTSVSGSVEELTDDSCERIDSVFTFLAEKKIEHSWFIGGGFMAYIAKRTKTFGDIDIFLDVPLKFFKLINEHLLSLGFEKSWQLDYALDLYYIKRSYGSGKFQLHLTTLGNTADTESYMNKVISDFDLKICAVGYNPVTLRINQYDMSHEDKLSNPDRVTKYMERAFNPELWNLKLMNIKEYRDGWNSRRKCPELHAEMEEQRNLNIYKCI